MDTEEETAEAIAAAIGIVSFTTVTAPDLTVPFSQIPAIPTRWLWQDVIPYGTATMWVGPGGIGKGLAIAAAAALVTTGLPFPGELEPREPAAVIMIAPEDDANEDLAFRLEAAGADMSLVKLLTYLTDGSRFRLPANIPDLQEAIAEIRAGTASQPGVPVGLVVLDPLRPLCGKSITPAVVESVVLPLQDLAREEDVGMIVSHHTTKDERVVAGSKALTDALRLVFMVSQTGKDGQRIMRTWKSNKGSDAKVPFTISGEDTGAHATFASGQDEKPLPGSRSARLRLLALEETA
jgi:hypothetical protein